MLNEDGELERIEMSDAAIKQQAVHLLVADALWEELQAQGYEQDTTCRFPAIRRNATDGDSTVTR